MSKYKIVAKNNNLAVHSVGYYGDGGKKKAQGRIDSGYCARHWADKEQAKRGFIVVVDDAHVAEGFTPEQALELCK